MSLIQELLEAGVQAPTGDNCQPWLFAEDGDAFTVRVDLACAASGFDVRQVATRLALGALLENMRLLAAARGRGIEHVVVDEGLGLDCALTTTAQPDLPAQLAASIYTRRTNRRPYARRALSDEQAAALEACGDGEASIAVRRGQACAAVFRLVQVGELVRWQHPPQPEEMFEKVRFTPTEKYATRDGLAYDTLGVGAPELAALRFLSKPGRVAALDRFGLGRALSAPSAGLLRRSGGLAVLCTPLEPLAGLVAAGQVMQRMWLTATDLGLAAQPLGPVSLMALRARWDLLEPFSPRHREVLMDLHRRWSALELCPEGCYPLLAFRLGHAPPVPPALRRPLSTFLVEPRPSAEGA